MTTLAKAKARANETFIVQASLTIVTYNHQNVFIVQATDVLIFVPFIMVLFEKGSYQSLLIIIVEIMDE